MLVVAQGLTRPATRVSRTGALVSLAPKTQCARRFASIAQIQTTTKDPASAEVADLRKVLRAYRLETGGTKQELLDRIASVAKIEVCDHSLYPVRVVFVSVHPFSTVAS